jgi:hypothetical protein
MKADDPWEQLKKGEAKEGIKQFEANYETEPSASSIMELGVAYMWIRQYAAAWELFSKSIEEYPKSISDFYGMAGTAKWCLNDVSASIHHWIDGLGSQFADTNGLGMHLPLLLFVASVMHPGSHDTYSAEKLLRQKTKDRRVGDWPGPIAQWVLGEIGDPELRAQCLDQDIVEVHDKEWLSEFYQAVRTYDRTKRRTFNLTMRKLSDTTRPEWADDDFFLARMRSEEFFIARHEASKF